MKLKKRRLLNRNQFLYIENNSLKRKRKEEPHAQRVWGSSPQGGRCMLPPPKTEFDAETTISPQQGSLPDF